MSDTGWKSPGTVVNKGDDHKRYWVGGSGNWSDDNNHWAMESGGSPADGNLPTLNDDVFIDENSGFGSGGTINTNTTFQVRSFTVSTNHTIQIGGSPYYQYLEIYGNFSVGTGTSIDANSITFYGGDIDLENGDIRSSNGIVFLTGGIGNNRLVSDIGSNVYNGTGFDYINLRVGDYRTGYLDFNDHNVITHSLALYKGEAYLGSGVLEVHYSFIINDWIEDVDPNIIVHEETSTVKIYAEYSEHEERYTYVDFGKNSSLYNIEIEGNGTDEMFIGNGHNSTTITCNEFRVNTVPSGIYICGGTIINLASFVATGSIGNLILFAGVEIGGSVTSVVINNGGSGYEVDDEIVISGGNECASAYVAEVDGNGAVTAFYEDESGGGAGYTTANGVGTSGGSGTGLTVNIVASAITSQSTLSKTSGIVVCDYLDISNSIATGGATWVAGVHSTDSGNNSGWIWEANSERGIYSKGISTNSSTRQIYTRGSILDGSTRGLYTKGISASSSQRSIYTKGIATTSSERGVYSKGSIQTFSNRTLYTKGVSTNSSQRGIFSIGSIQGWSQRGLYTIGSIIGSSSRNIYLSGIDTKDSERSIYTRGQLASSSERSLYTWGSDKDNSERNVYIRGISTSLSERNLYTIGCLLDSSERSLYLKTNALGYSERGLYTKGKLSDSSERELYLKTIDFGYSTRGLYTIGGLSDSSERSIYLPVNHIVGSERGIWTYGKMVGVPEMYFWDGMSWIKIV